MKKLTLILLFAAVAFGAMAQQPADEVLFDMNGKHYYKAPFMKEFLRSVGKDPSAAPTACTYEKRKALEDYVQLYVNFQAKLTDAYANGFDTMASLQRELASYRKELAAPYLIDSMTMQSLLREAYDRNHYALHAAHILVPCREGTSPEDTLKAYKHCQELLAKIKGGADFYEVSKAEMREQRLKDRDPQVRAKADQINPNEGDLGCFTVLDMVYPFECAAYSLKPGEVSWVRSKYGYHVVKLFDRYNYYGKTQLAHIWIPESDPKAEGKINSAFSEIASGVDFGTIAKDFSADRNTAKTGGVMPELACNQLPYAYVEQVAKGLPVNAVSKPFHSDYGWHIIKVLKRDTIPSYEEMVPYYKSRMTRGERATKPKNIFIDQCKRQYDFVDYTQTKTSKKKNAPYAASLDAVRALVTDSVFSAIFSCDTSTIIDMRPLFKIGDKKYNSRDFAAYLLKEKHVSARCDMDKYVRNRYEEFVSNRVFDYADSRLEQDNAEFAELIDEYRHGLMIFAYNDRMVWSQAIKDTIGFEEFYKQASAAHDYNDTNDAVYFWNERARVRVYTILDSNQVPTAKALKIFKKAEKKGWDNARLMDEFAARTKEGKTVFIEEQQLVEQGHQQLLSANEWRLGTFVHPLDASAKLPDTTLSNQDGYQILKVEQILQPELKSRQEARGYYLNDYQNYLEAENIKRLRQQYNVVIHQDVIDAITY